MGIFVFVEFCGWDSKVIALFLFFYSAKAGVHIA